MKIHKISHCCLVIDLKTKEGQSRRILLDPGFYSVEKHSKVNKIDIVLITHEHADHFHIESLKELLKNHPEVEIITNTGVGAILVREGITHHVMEHGDIIDTKGVHIEAYGKDHALMHKSIPPAANVGFFIQNTFFFPGDAFTLINKEIKLLALPVAGPWMKISEALDYALTLKPIKAFPVHDAGSTSISFVHSFVERVLGPKGIEFINLEDGGTIDFT